MGAGVGRTGTLVSAPVFPDPWFRTSQSLFLRERPSSSSTVGGVGVGRETGVRTGTVPPPGRHRGQESAGTPCVVVSREGALLGVRPGSSRRVWCLVYQGVPGEGSTSESSVRRFTVRGYLPPTVLLPFPFLPPPPLTPQLQEGGGR